MKLEKILALLSFLVPGRLLSTRYLFKRLEILGQDPETCEHKWLVIAAIRNSVELQVQCVRCFAYSEVSDPSQQEWNDAFGAMENPYPWDDDSRVNPVRNG
ncbi:hypothetical protein VWY34_06600 [Phaeobacter sp. JH20_02]|uniref:hypothetical protein n=1 Tax=Phaeobacter TaxID=302485 RepID=UPI000971BA35|nr:hypothetical protein [Phaeobacter inhibens]APX15665.1 hypothetical protein BWR17_07335 [Phaeobacter inhibens]UWR91652.1 hypothetical protein K4K96_13205 [Phaeobacter inhibens]